MAEGGQQSLLLLQYNDLSKEIVTVPSSISLSELKRITAEKFGITQPVTLEYFDNDEDISQWVAVGDDFKPPSKGKLRVSVSETQEWDLYCLDPELPESESETPVNGTHPPSEVAGGWAQVTKLWGSRDNPLKVHFLNPEVLQRWNCGDVNDILRWAGEWNTERTRSVPEFKEAITESDKKNAQVRVSFGDGMCWSKIGTDAKKVKKSDETMHLSLQGEDEVTQRSLVIQQFGRCLGLEYEHQHSNFWEHLKKHDIVDEEMMKKDLGGKKIFKEDWYKKKGGGETTTYDPESIMHFWFDVKWLKNRNYREGDCLTYIENEPQRRLSEDAKKVLKGIVERRRNIHRLARKPSIGDLKYLEKIYSMNR